MDWIHLPSDDIGSAKYENNTLYLAFSNGARYAYFDVPQRIFTEFLSAESYRAFFNANIRGKYRYHKIF